MTNSGEQKKVFPHQFMEVSDELSPPSASFIWRNIPKIIVILGSFLLCGVFIINANFSIMESLLTTGSILAIIIVSNKIRHRNYKGKSGTDEWT